MVCKLILDQEIDSESKQGNSCTRCRWRKIEHEKVWAIFLGFLTLGIMYLYFSISYQHYIFTDLTVNQNELSHSQLGEKTGNETHSKPFPFHMFVSKIIIKSWYFWLLSCHKSILACIYECISCLKCYWASQNFIKVDFYEGHVYMCVWFLVYRWVCWGIKIWIFLLKIHIFPSCCANKYGTHRLTRMQLKKNNYQFKSICGSTVL